MKTLVINSANYVPGSGNTFTYQFPSAVSFGKGDQVAVGSVAVFNSTFNITAARGNNVATLTFPTYNSGGTLVMSNVLTVTFPDGYYTIPQINTYLAQQMVANNLHMTNNGTNVTFVQIQQVTNSFAVQIILQDIPTTTQATTLGYKIPTSSPFANNATQKTTPTIAFNAGFGSLIGFPASSLTTNSAAQVTSSTSPTCFIYTNSLPLAISPINSYVMTCSLLGMSIHSNPPNVLCTIPLSASLGNFINITPSQYIFCDIAPNTYSQIVIKFFDQAMNPITLVDTELVLMLMIRENGE